MPDIRINPEDVTGVELRFLSDHGTVQFTVDQENAFTQKLWLNVLKRFGPKSRKPLPVVLDICGLGPIEFRPQPA